MGKWEFNIGSSMKDVKSLKRREYLSKILCP
jgi:hypothetical protein